MSAGAHRSADGAAVAAIALPRFEELAVAASLLFVGIRVLVLGRLTQRSLSAGQFVRISARRRIRNRNARQRYAERKTDAIYEQRAAVSIDDFNRLRLE